MHSTYIALPAPVSSGRRLTPLPSSAARLAIRQLDPCYPDFEIAFMLKEIEVPGLIRVRGFAIQQLPIHPIFYVNSHARQSAAAAARRLS
jgi:hypothetical protein